MQPSINPSNLINVWIRETFKDFPPSSLALIETLLSIDPDSRDTTTAALNSKFFTSEPCACEPSSLPKSPPSKEMDLKLRDEAARRQRALGRKSHNINGNRRSRVNDKAIRAIPAPVANAELQTNLNRLRMMSDNKAKSKSEKFPPPHQDGGVGNGTGTLSFAASDASFCSSVYDVKPYLRSKRRKDDNEEPHTAPSLSFVSTLFNPYSVGFGRR